MAGGTGFVEKLFMDLDVGVSGLDNLDRLEEKLEGLFKKGGVAADAASATMVQALEEMLASSNKAKSGLTEFGNKVDVLNRKFQTLTKQVHAYKAGLGNMPNINEQFQRQTTRDIQTGVSLFASEGGTSRQGRGIQPINDALQQAQEMSLGANEGMRRYQSTMAEGKERIMSYTGSQEMLEKQQKESTSSTKDMGGAFGKTFGILMNTMFIGMALSQTFGRLSRSMLEMFGVTDTFSAAFKSVLMPVFEELSPVLNKIAFALMDLPDGVKMAIGAFVALMSVLGPVLFFGSQIALLATSGLALGTVATVAGVAVGALALLAAGFKLGMALGRHFSDQVIFAMNVAGTVIERFISTTIGMFENFGQIIDNTVALVDNLIREDFKAAWKNLKTIVSSVLDNVRLAFKQLFLTDIIEFIGEAASKMLQKGENMMGNLADGIKNKADAITSAIENALPDWAVEGLKMASEGVESMGAGSHYGFENANSVNDFILTGDGALETHPQDTLIGTTGDPSNIGGEKTKVNVEINDPVMKEEADIEDLVDEVEDRVNRSTRGRTGIT